MHFQWYPGHMTKARRMMQENIKLIDLIIELVDARVPLSSRNPDIDELGKNKARLILLNKSDLAEERINDEWIDYFKDRGYSAVKVNSKKGGGMNQIRSAIQESGSLRLSIPSRGRHVRRLGISRALQKGNSGSGLIKM